MKDKFQIAQQLFVDPLDDLLTSAMREASKRTVRPIPSKDSKAEVAARPKLTSGFYAPENWERVCTVSLIHQSTNTLLGNFDEFRYIPNRKTKKLVRVEGPRETDGVEYVAGSWWLQQETERHTDPKSWIESRAAVIGITLAECGLHCDAAEVTVRLEHGWIARVELIKDTRFTCATRDTFLILPSGLDVLEAMSIDSKLVLKAEMRIGEEAE